MSSHRYIGSNVLLASILACLSYVPMIYVTKGSLIFAVILFVLDPIPPISRLLSVLLVISVNIISKLHRQYMIEIESREPDVIIIDASKEQNTSSNDKIQIRQSQDINKSKDI